MKLPAETVADLGKRLDDVIKLSNYTKDAALIQDLAKIVQELIKEL